MAIVIQSTPADWSSINGDLLYVVYEATKATDPATYQSYKYVCDVLVGGTLVATLKTFPDPTNNKGIFNVARVVRNYLTVQFNPTATSFKVQELGDGDWSLSVQCNFREEYVGPGSLQETDDSARVFYNHYNGRLISGKTILDHFTNNIASARSRINRVNSFRSFICYNNDYSKTAIDIEISAYDKGNILLGNEVKTLSISMNKLIIMDASPIGCNSFFTYQIGSSVAYYIMSFDGDIFRFNIYSECKYPAYCLHFMNKFGGFESFDFYKVSKRTSTVERKQYQQESYRIASDGSYNIATSGNVLYDGLTTFASKFNEKMNLTSDLLTDAEYAWLKELAYSPIVYFEDNGYLVPVSITQTDYEERTFANSRNTPLEIEIDFMQTLNTQFR